MGKSEAYVNGAFMAFGIAIGYAGNFVPDRSLSLLAFGLIGCTVAFVVLALYRRSWEDFQNHGLQTFLLVLAVIAPLTSKTWSALWAIVFILTGCVGVGLNITQERLPNRRRIGN